MSDFTNETPDEMHARIKGRRDSIEEWVQRNVNAKTVNNVLLVVSVALAIKNRKLKKENVRLMVENMDLFQELELSTRLIKLLSTQNHSA